MNMETVSINEQDLTIAKTVAVARYSAEVEAFAGAKRERVQNLRDYVEENWLSDTAKAQYGFNTGVGALKNVRISADQIKRFQKLYVKSHCVGLGDPLEIEIVRGAMLLQANALARGFSGIRPLLVDKLIEMLNKRIHPVVPEHGSLGASGDLAPLTHIVSVMVGEEQAEVWVGKERRQLKDLLDGERVLRFSDDGREVSLETIELHGKEAVSLTNSTAVMLSFAAHLIYDTEILLKNADIAAALSLEAMMCEKSAFDEELHELRHQKGQITTARNIRNLTANSRRMTPEARLAYKKHITEKEVSKNLSKSGDVGQAETVKQYKLEHEYDRNRIQDAYSLRCIPQVHGACKDAYHYVRDVVERELLAVTDNPVIFPNSDGFEAKSGGNFHGEPLALAMDFLGIALAEIGSIAERRVFRLLSPSMSFGLPRNLTGGEAGLNSGYMLIQYAAAALVSENKVLAHPASVDSIPTSDNQEDHVSMGLTAARKAKKILQNVQNLNATEVLCAVQGLELSCSAEGAELDNFPLGEGTGRAFTFLREAHSDQADDRPAFKKMHDDDYIHSKVHGMSRLCKQGKLIMQVERLGL
jgi:histidine ammonia-lyase